MSEFCCPNLGPNGEHSDAAKRASDNVNLHLMADRDNAVGKWVALALSDGSSDGVLYERKQEAVRHQGHNEQWYAFVRIPPSGMDLCSAESFLRYCRLAYDAGFRLPDPDDVHGGKEIIRPLTNESYARQLLALGRAGMKRGGR